MSEEQDPSEPLFPIHLLRPDDPLPEASTAYLVGRDGIFVTNTTVAFQAVTPVSEIPTLQALTPWAEYLLPPMPAECVAQILRFFRAVWKQSKSEAILLISYHPRRKTFRLDAPSQGVSPGHIRYEMPRIHPDFILVGSVHSHGSLPAGHSETDLEDELNFDGIHITFGRMDRRLVEIVATLGVGGERFPQSISQVFEGTRLYDCYMAPNPSIKGKNARQSVMAYCFQYLPALCPLKQPDQRAVPGFRRAYQGYRVTVPDDALEEECAPLPEWFTQVTHEPHRSVRPKRAPPSKGLLYLDEEFTALARVLKGHKKPAKH